MKKPKLPRILSRKTLDKMTGKQLYALKRKLNNNASSLWRWGFGDRKLSTKGYIKHRARLTQLNRAVDSASDRFWKSSRGFKSRMKRIKRNKA